MGQKKRPLFSLIILALAITNVESAYGALNLGFSWQFTKDISVLTGYQFYNNKNLANTATIQMDINF